VLLNLKDIFLQVLQLKDEIQQILIKSFVFDFLLNQSIKGKMSRPFKELLLAIA